MPANYLHGIETTEVERGPRAIRVVKSAVIALVGTAPVGPVDQLTLCLNDIDAAQFGAHLKGFSIPEALQGIYDFGAGTVLVVNVLDPTIHSTNVTGQLNQFADNNLMQLEHGALQTLQLMPAEGDTLYKQNADYTANLLTGQVQRLPSALANTAPVATLRLQDLSQVNLRDQIKNVPQAAEVSHKDPATKQLVTYKIENNQAVAVPSSMTKTTTSADTQKSRKRSASTEEAKAKTEAQLAKANRERTTGTWSSIGQPNLLSGNVVTLAAAGKLGGRYLITASQHRMTRTGYTVSQSVSRVSEA